MRVEKFPRIESSQGVWIWDSRQAPSGSDEVVCLFAEQPAETRAQLLARAPARVFVDATLYDRDAALTSYERRADLRRELALASAESCRFPSRRLKLVGVTGTNGKTTCASLLRRIFVENGWRSAEIGTLGVSLWAGRQPESPERALETGFTTPDAPTLQTLLRSLVDDGVDAVVMEVSSHALSLRRADGCDFDAALFTNLTQDHLDYHGTMEAYEAAKAELFGRLLADSVAAAKRPVAVLNANEAGHRIARRVAPGARANVVGLGEGFEVESHDVGGLKIRRADGASFASPMLGRYNAENIVGCLEVARGLGVSDEVCRRAVASFGGARGRLERVIDPRGNRHVFVDYAHTPDAVLKVIDALKELRPSGGRLVCVVGCGGDRDRSKRPLMARAALTADEAVFTSDNPRSESPTSILDDMTRGLAGGRYRAIVDRREAIESVIAGLAPGDICVVAGKGHEDYQIVGTERRVFSDVEVCRSALESSGVGTT